jgi:group I intron endonuclease
MRINYKLGSLKVLNNHLIVYPTPLNLNYAFNFGSLSGIVLGVQILTGILLAMHYTAHVDHAFASVVHLMYDVPSGMILRYTHANGASLFFVVVYIHILRGMYYSSGNMPREIVWISGVIILLVMIITAFIGYHISHKWLFNDFNLSFAYCLLIPITPHTLLINSKNGNTIKIIPIKSYYNLNLCETQHRISKDNKQKAAIYCVYNEKNGNCYIGSAATNRINVRFRNHCINKTGSNKPLTRAINKYGIENFSFHILEFFSGFVHKENLKKNHLKLLELETSYISRINPIYNILTIAGSSLGFKHSIDTRIMMKQNYSIERKNRIGNLNKGLSLTEETKKLISEKAKNRYSNTEYKKEFLEKIRKTLFKKKPICLVDSQNIQISEYKSITEVSKVFSSDRKTVRKYINNKDKIFKKIGYLKTKD